MKWTVIKDFTYKMKKGDVVEIDKFRGDKNCLNGVKVRVVNVWTTGVWFDIDWFKEGRKLVEWIK